jgi:hypothetical protein
VKSLPAALTALLCLLVSPALAQRPTVEIDTTAGFSTDDVQALSSQVRVFGETPGGWRYFLEASGAAHAEGRHETDAFSGAYPYEEAFTLMETYAEKSFASGGRVGALRVGRYRTPFGIYNRSDHAYQGYLRAQMIRYGEDFSLSNYWLEAGADLLFGTPQFQAEASLGIPSEPHERRRGGTSAVARVQGYTGNLILGASYLDTPPSQVGDFVQGRTRFWGVDARWMEGGTQVRGEWIDGRSFDGVKTRGGYADLILHRPFMGPVTGVARVERIRYDAGPFSFKRSRITAGAKVRLTRSLLAQINAIHGTGFEGRKKNSLDVALTYTVRR